ncbi:MAG: hypothetical protein ACRC46_05985 [Thermoguttaceae bacterium]
MPKWCSFVMLFAVLSFAAGCGAKTPLQGKVVFSDDQSPLTVGTVLFTSSTFLARGEIKPDGTFVVESAAEGDGIPPGTYQVVISGATKDAGTDASGMPKSESLINPDVLNGSPTPLNIEITSATKKLELTVEKPKGRK